MGFPIRRTLPYDLPKIKLSLIKEKKLISESLFPGHEIE